MWGLRNANEAKQGKVRCWKAGPITHSERGENETKTAKGREHRGNALGINTVRLASCWC